MRTSAYQPSSTSDNINQQLNRLKRLKRLNSFICFHLFLILVPLFASDCDATGDGISGWYLVN